VAGKVLIDVTNRMNREAIAESVDGSSASEKIQRNRRAN
jgi:predicted dinucleotide-binding enzyme